MILCKNKLKNKIKKKLRATMKNNLNALNPNASQQCDLFIKQIEDNEPMPPEKQ